MLFYNLRLVLQKFGTKSDKLLHELLAAEKDVFIAYVNISAYVQVNILLYFQIF